MASACAPWLAAARGGSRRGAGARALPCSPPARAGLIVVDEHDASYKQRTASATTPRDLALVRAPRPGVPVLLGSATPSLETLANVAAGRYAPLRLTARAGIGAAAGGAHRGPAPRASQPRAERRAGCGPGRLPSDAASRPSCSATGAASLRCCCATTAAGTRTVRAATKPMTLHRRPPHLACHHCGARQSGAGRLSAVREPGAAGAGPGHRAPGGGVADALPPRPRWCASTARPRAARTRSRTFWPVWGPKHRHLRRRTDAGQGSRPAQPHAGGSARR